MLAFRALSSPSRLRSVSFPLALQIRATRVGVPSEPDFWYYLVSAHSRRFFLAERYDLARQNLETILRYRQNALPLLLSDAD